MILIDKAKVAVLFLFIRLTFHKEKRSLAAHDLAGTKLQSSDNNFEFSAQTGFELFSWIRINTTGF